MNVLLEYSGDDGTMNENLLTGKYLNNLETYSMKWTDVQDIAIELYETHPDVDPQYVRFTDLHNWVMALPGFDDDPDHSNKKILEAIQMAWIDEAS